MERAAGHVQRASDAFSIGHEEPFVVGDHIAAHTVGPLPCFGIVGTSCGDERSAIGFVRRKVTTLNCWIRAADHTLSLHVLPLRRVFAIAACLMIVTE